MHDVVIVGGSYAGLAAAMQLGRARRDVLVLDAGQRRNRFASHAHGILGFDGESPAEIAAKGRAQVLAYPSVRWREAAATGARRAGDGFVVTAGGEEHAAKRVILATGVIDELPPVPGLVERWGKTVFHCPYCDGYERDRGDLGVLASGPFAHHFAALAAEWSRPGGTTLFLNGGAAPEEAELAGLASRGIRVELGAVLEVRDADRGIEVVLGGGTSHAMAGLFVTSRTRLPGDFPDALGCELEQGPMGAYYKTDPLTKQTTVPGVYACGDAALMQGSVTFALADGARAGVMAHQSLVFEHVPR